MMTLYHYTGLFHLSTILREGALSRGEIAEPSLQRGEQAVSLTSQTDPDRVLCWGPYPLPEKTSVRFVCLIPEGDSRLEPARMAWKRLRVGKQFLKALDHYGQSKWWYFCHGPIPSERFRV